MTKRISDVHGPPTCLPSMKEERQRGAQVGRQRERLPEIPKSPAAVLPADLQTRTSRGKATLNWLHKRMNRTSRYSLPCQILQQHLGSPSEAEWLL